MAFNHTGVIVHLHNGARMRSVKLRSSKKFWISECGAKFYRNTGRRYGKEPSVEVLDVDSLPK